MNGGHTQIVVFKNIFKSNTYKSKHFTSNYTSVILLKTRNYTCESKAMSFYGYAHYSAHSTREASPNTAHTVNQ